MHPDEGLLLDVPQRSAQLLLRHAEQVFQVLGSFQCGGNFQRAHLAAFFAGLEQMRLAAAGLLFRSRSGCGLLRGFLRLFGRLFFHSEQGSLRPEQHRFFHQFLRNAQSLGNLIVCKVRAVAAEQIEQHFQLGRRCQLQILVYHGIRHTEHLPEAGDMYAKIHKKFLPAKKLQKRLDSG